MNRIEKIVYNAVKRTPALKLFIRNLYQALFDLLPRQKNFVKFHLTYKEGYFYGFHDTTPFSLDNTKVLANHILIPLRMPKPEEELEVGFFSFNGKELGDFVKLGSSRAWNYHKGCRSQWVDDKHIIYNTAIDGVLKSELVDIRDKSKINIDYPIDTVSPDGKYATSFSYERLEMLMPGYGYPYKDADSYIDELAPVKSGLFLIDLASGKRKLLVDLKTLSEDAEIPEAQRGFRHYVTHSEFSENGRYISFMHRWVGNEIRLRWTRLLIYDLKENRYFSLPAKEMVSHYVWRGNKLLAYCRVNGTDCHVLFDVENKDNYRTILPDQLNSDGHQTFISDNTFITDTYPDRRRMAKLYMVDLLENRKEMIASLYHPKRFRSELYSHICCDLHPCASVDGRFVCFDSVFTGKRSICVMAINDRES